MSKHVQYLSITDIHFDPFALNPVDRAAVEQATPQNRAAVTQQRTNALVKALAAAVAANPTQRGEGWRTALNTYFAGHEDDYAPSGKDANHPILRSLMEHVQSPNPTAAFFLYSGDYVGHDLWWGPGNVAVLAHYATSKPAGERLAVFIDDLIRYIAAMFTHYLPGLPVLPLLGNTDAHRGDYGVQWNGAFQRTFADTWAPLMPSGTDPAAFKASFGEGGYYTCPVPGIAGLEVIAFNDIYGSSSHHRTQWFDGADLPKITTWVTGELDATSNCWLLFHVPLGGDDWGGGGLMLRQGFEHTIYDLVRTHAHKIRVAFSGHTHMDDFRLGSSGGSPVVLNHITPSVSPVFHNNPAYQVHTADAQGELIDIQTSYLDRAAGWTHEYDFAATYGAGPLTPAAMEAVHDRIVTPHSAAGDHFRRFFYSSSGVSSSPHNPLWTQVHADMLIDLDAPSSEE